MKRVILTLILILLVGCSTSKNEFTIGDESTVNITNNKEVELSFKENTLSNTGGTLVITNNSTKSIQFGEPYEIEIKKDGKWHKIEVDLFFDLPLYTLEPNEKKEMELSWKNSYGSLAKGSYRLIKGVNINSEDIEYKEEYMTIEFSF